MSRVMRMSRIATSSVSPGSAPSTKNGPVIGFGRSADLDAAMVEAMGIRRRRGDGVAAGDGQGRGVAADRVVKHATA